MDPDELVRAALAKIRAECPELRGTDALAEIGLVLARLEQIAREAGRAEGRAEGGQAAGACHGCGDEVSLCVGCALKTARRNATDAVVEQAIDQAMGGLKRWWKKR